jgi:hypothetical protein
MNLYQSRGRYLKLVRGLVVWRFRGQFALAPMLSLVIWTYGVVNAAPYKMVPKPLRGQQMGADKDRRDVPEEPREIYPWEDVRGTGFLRAPANSIALALYSSQGLFLGMIAFHTRACAISSSFVRRL